MRLATYVLGAILVLAMLAVPTGIKSAHDSPILATSIQIDAVEDPQHGNWGKPMAIDPATGNVYVVSEPLDKVSVIDASTNTITATITTPSPHSLAVDSTNSALYVTNRGQASVSVFDLGDNSFVTSITVGAVPVDIAVNESLGRIYVANAGSQTLSVINASTKTVAASLPLGFEPRLITVNSSSNRAYVAPYYGNFLVAIHDAGSQFSFSTIEGLPFAAAGSIAADRVTNTVFAGSNSNDGPLAAIDGETKEVNSIGPYYQHLAVDPGAGILYTQTESQRFLLSTSDYSIIDQFEAGGDQIVLNESTGVLYLLRNNPPSLHVYDHDSDMDGIADLVDNCSNEANPNQNDLDSDGIGDLCDLDVDGDGANNDVDPDDDNDGSHDAEGMCGSDAIDPAKQPERVDGIFAGSDEDGDGLIDEPLPAGSEAHDCDGDGYIGSAESHVFGGAGGLDQDPCGTDAWPSDLNAMAGGLLDSFNRINVLDLTSFLSPTRYLGTDVGTNPGDVRWDLSPGSGIFTTDINVMDLTTLIAGPSAYPPMLEGERALNGPTCPWAP